MANEPAGRKIGVMVHAIDGPGVLHQLTGVIAHHRGDIGSVEIVQVQGGRASIYFELVLPGEVDALLGDVRALPIVTEVGRHRNLAPGLWQAHHHRRRRRAGGTGRHRSDLRSRPPQHTRRAHLGGHHPAGRGATAGGSGAGSGAPPTRKALVLAGSLMGGEIEQAVREVREKACW